MIKAIIIEDNKLAAQQLAHQCSKFPNMHVLGTFINGIHAVEILHKQKVDLIFLDIETPDLDGVDFINNCKDLPYIIITTSNPKYAARCIHEKVIGFIEKPVSIASIFKAMEELRSIGIGDKNETSNMSQEITENVEDKGVFKVIIQDEKQEDRKGYYRSIQSFF